MKLTHFRFETDADGIATATWDMAARSMNVITPEVMAELDQIIDSVVGDEAIKGCVMTFMERAAMSHVAVAMPSASVSKRKCVSFIIKPSR